jgi:hypothetical protein
MFLKLTPRLLVPLHTLQVVPKLGTTERCAFERVSRYRSDRLGSKYLGLSKRPGAGVDTTDPTFDPN